MYLIYIQAISEAEYALIGAFLRDCLSLISRTFNAVLSKYFNYQITDANSNDSNQN